MDFIMLELIPKIIVYKLFRNFGFPKILPMNYTISLLYTCNSRCKTCNIYKKKADNLNTGEYKKIFKKIGKSPYWITLSGGEPFLRNDIVEVCKIIYRYSKPGIINIPSNGILTNKIVQDVKKISISCSKIKTNTNLILNGVY